MDKSHFSDEQVECLKEFWHSEEQQLGSTTDSGIAGHRRGLGAKSKSVNFGSLPKLDLDDLPFNFGQL